MWAMPSFVADHVAASLNSRMVRSDDTSIAVATVHATAASQAPRLTSYPEVVNHLLKRYANDQGIAETDAAISRYSQPAIMTPLQYREDLFAKAIRVGDVYGDAVLNDIFIEGIDASIRQSLRKYWATHPHADLTDLAFVDQSLLAIQEGSNKLEKTPSGKCRSTEDKPPPSVA